MTSTESTLQNKQDKEQQQKCKECNEKIKDLELKLTHTIADLTTARQNLQPTGPIYTEKQRLEEQIKLIEIEKEKYCLDTCNPEPGNDNQSVIAAATVRRKLAAEITQ